MVVVEKRTKLLITGAACITFMVFSICFNVYGPMLPSLAKQIGSNQQELSYILAVRSLVSLFASLTIGKVYDHINRQIGLITGLAVITTTLVLVPLCKSFWQLMFVQLAVAPAGAAVEVAVNAWILELWKEESNPYMQTLHFVFSLGTAIAPFICEPFLSNTASNTTSSTIETAVMTETFAANGTNTNHNSDGFNESMPFFIAAAGLVVAVLAQLYLYIAVSYKQEDRSINTVTEDEEELVDPINSETMAYLPRSYFVMVVVWACLVISFEGGTELNSFTYFTTFAINTKLSISPSKAAIMSGTLNGSFTVSRFISIFLATRMKVVTMLYMNLTIINIGNLLIWFSVYTSFELGLWIGVIFLGFGFSSSWPAVFAMVEQRINVTNVVCSILVSATVLLAVIDPLIEGRLIEKWPIVFAYINLGSGAICFVAFVLLHHTDTIRKRYTEQHSKRDSDK
ncbi:Major facilitator superfamily domain-containing protein 4A [Halotydeus destructor]|nr:Major facilitator superfamily domain-containing protein 4A [Halotydeus destructor]